MRSDVESAGSPMGRVVREFLNVCRRRDEVSQQQAAPIAMRCRSTDSSHSLQLLQGTDSISTEQVSHLLKGQELDDAECHVGGEPQTALQSHCTAQQCTGNAPQEKQLAVCCHSIRLCSQEWLLPLRGPSNTCTGEEVGTGTPSRHQHSMKY